MPWAVTDVHNQLTYFREKGELRTADAFKKCVRRAFILLEESALQYQIVDEPMRRCPLEPFRHGVIYEIEGELVVIHAVAHARQKPRDWHARSRK